MPARKASPRPQPVAGRAVVRKEALSLEEALLRQIKAAGLPEPMREYPPIPGRKFRADFCFIAPPGDHRRGVLCEVEGGVYSGGRHVRGSGYELDCLKYSLCAIEGWVVIRVTGTMIHDGTALSLLERALESARSNRQILDELLATAT